MKEKKRTSGKHIGLLLYFIAGMALIVMSLQSSHGSLQDRFDKVLVWDVAGYYKYLPALFIYKDVKTLSYYPELLDQYRMTPYFDQAQKLDNGNYVMKHSLGQALVLSPGFFIGHAIASHSNDYPADGYSLPYQAAIKVWTLILSLIGMYFLLQVLMVYFEPLWAGMGVLVVLLASNYLEYTAMQGAMTHNTLFTITVVLLWSIIRFYKSPSKWKALGIGALIGLGVLIRPTEILLALPAILWGVNNKDQLLERWQFFKSQNPLLVIALLAFLVVTSLQLMYWKYVSGYWIVYSYGEQGFDFLRPNIYKGLFSAKSGWFMYSPIMLLLIPGLYLLFNKKHEGRILILSYFLLVIYVTYSWKIWDYGGSLGARALVQSYPIFSIPLVFAMRHMFHKNASLRILLILFASACIYLNLYWTWQAHRGKYFHAGEMNTRYFFSVIGRWKVHEETLKLLDLKHIVKAPPKETRVLKEITFNENQDQPCIDLKPDFIQGLCINGGLEYTPKFSYQFEDAFEWIRVTATLTMGQKEWDMHKNPTFVVSAEDATGKTLSWQQLRIFRYMDGHQHGELYIDVKMPKSQIENLHCYFTASHYFDAYLVHKVTFTALSF